MSAQKDHVGLTNTQHDYHSEIDPALLAEGLELIYHEKSMPLRETFKYHWRALLWGMVLSLALVMDGYDGAVTLSFFALPSFKKEFGVEKNGVYNIPANWQAGLQNCGLPGGFIGLAITAYCQDRYGSRRTYMGGMVLVICIVFLFVFVQSLGMLLGAQALAALAWAMFNTLSASYAAEICPIQLRGVATSFISMCWGMGSFIAAGVNRGALAIEGNWGWRMAYCVQWAWPVPLLIFAYFAPESPWWLVRQGRLEDAKKTLTRTAASGYWNSRNVDSYIAVIQHTNEIEKAETAGASFWDLWRGTNRRRTEIQMGLWACQVWSGTAMTSYAVQFLKDAGMTTVAAFNFNILITSMNIIGCGVEMGLITRFGRRPMILTGLLVLGLMLLLIGVFGSVPKTKYTLQGVGACCAIINLVYHASVGPLTYTVAAEVPSTRLRVKSVAWGRAFYSINYNATSQLTPRMVSEIDWNWGAKAAFFWLGGNLGVTLWAFFRLPETGKRSYTELDILFANKVPAGKFKSTVVQDEAAAELPEDIDEKKVVVEHAERAGQATLA